MKKKKKDILSKLLRGALLFVVLLGTFDATKLHVMASEEVIREDTDVDILRAELMEVKGEKQGNTNARTMMYECTISISCSEAGLHIEITTGTLGDASVLGVKDIVIKQKVWYGWKTIATGSGGEVANNSIMGVVIDYANVEVGETYRVTCVHYADVNGYEEVENDTGEFVFTY